MILNLAEQLFFLMIKELIIIILLIIQIAEHFFKQLFGLSPLILLKPSFVMIIRKLMEIVQILFRMKILLKEDFMVMAWQVILLA